MRTHSLVSPKVKRGKREVPLSFNKQGTTVDQHAGLASQGHPLDTPARSYMQARFGHNFDHVRVHDDSQTASSASALSAAAYTVGSNIFFGANQYAPHTHEGHQLLAHELAHVVQYDQAGKPSSRKPVSNPGDTAEQEAKEAAIRVNTGIPVQISNTPDAPISRGVLDWLEDKASGAVDFIGDAASGTVDSVSGIASGAADLIGDATGHIGNAASAAWDTVSNAGSATWDVISGVGSEIAKGVEEEGLFGAIYEGMKENAGYVSKGGSWLEGKIDWLQDEAAGGVQNLADMADGIPVLEQVADAGSWLFDTSTQVSAGAWQGATTLGTGLLSAAANPVDTAKGLFTMAEHTPSIVPGLPNVFRLGHDIYDVAANDKDFSSIAALNPIDTMKEDASFWGNVASSFLQPYRDSIGNDGDYAQAGGRALFDIASLFMGVGEANAASRGMSIVDDAARVASVADDASRVAGLADDAARVATVADDASRVTSLVDDAARSTGFSDEAARAVTMSDETGRAVTITDDLVEINTSTDRMNQLADIADSGDVRWVETDPVLYDAWDTAKGRRRAGPSKPPRTEFNNQRGRFNTQLEKHGQPLEGDVHHWRYPIEQYSNEAVSSSNMYVTREGSALPTAHTELHRAMGAADKPFAEMFWGQQPQIQHMFEFWNSNLRLGDVMSTLDDWFKLRPGS